MRYFGILKKEEIKANVGHRTTSIVVKNEGDRPIQVGSHYHFFEANKFRFHQLKVDSPLISYFNRAMPFFFFDEKHKTIETELFL